jgi:hypothetical protein
MNGQEAIPGGAPPPIGRRGPPLLVLGSRRHGPRQTSGAATDLADLVARDRATTAALLAHLAEVDARKLYLPAAYPSMYALCVGELRMSGAGWSCSRPN